MPNAQQTLVATKPIAIRFSEVDSMSVVWHGSYVKYFEDAREAFGLQYGLDYMTIYNHGFYAPLVDLSFQYKRALSYQSKPVVKITYRPTAAAKIVFDYEITDAVTGDVAATGHSVQVFTDLEGNLEWANPTFYAQWKAQWGQ